MQAISRVRHTDKYQCVLLCIEKERQGFECIRGIEHVSHYHKNFRINGGYAEYTGASESEFWEAIYRKRMDEVV